MWKERFFELYLILTNKGDIMRLMIKGKGPTWRYFFLRFKKGTKMKDIVEKAKTKNVR